MGEFFLHPGLAALAGALVSVPIIIHLLNRRRFQVVQWGAMAFLLAAHRKTRRRIELENLILLLLRALAVALLGLAIARPSLSPESPLASAFAGRRDVVIVLDDSYSMAYRDGASTLFDRGVASARGILESLKPARQDQATLILAKQKPVRVSRHDIDKARRELSRLTEPSYEAMNLAATLELAVDEVDSFAGEEKEKQPNTNGATLYFITDLQRSTFFPRSKAAKSDAAPPKDAKPAAANDTKTPDAAGLNPIQSACSALAKRKVIMRVVDVGAAGAASPDNVGVVDVRCGEDMPAVGVAVEVKATLKNFGGAPRANVIVTPTVDGNRAATQTVSLAAGEEREVTIPLTFRDPGDHAVDVSVDEDRLAIDDRRPFIMHVRPALRVLLVDGAPDPDPEISATGMMELVLSPPEEPMTAAPFTLVGGGAADRSKLAAQPELLDQADLVVVANVEGFSEETAARLQDFVEAGGGLCIIAGDKIDAASYTQRLRRGSDPHRWLLPATLGSIRDIPSREYRPWRVANLPDPLPPAFEFFGPPERRVLLTEVPVFRFFSADVGEDDARGGAVVQARFNDPESSPFFIMKPLGRGHVGLITTALNASPERRWNRISESVRTFVPLVFDLLHSLASGAADSRNLRIGDPIRAEVRGFPRSATVVDPTGRSDKLAIEAAKRLTSDDAPAAAPPTAQSDRSDRFLLPAYTTTERPGIYTLEVDTSGGVGAVNATSFKYAIAVDPEEGDLTRAAGETLGAALPQVDVKLSSGVEEESLPAIEGPRSELWKALLAAAAGVLVLESALATLFGRSRS